MGKRLSDKERVAYIRRGNELFNNGKYKEAETIFMLTNYRDGILRIANRYYYELRKPLVALKYYYKINAREKIEEIKERMLFALKRLIRDDDNKKEGSQNPPEETDSDDNNEEPFSISDTDNEGAIYPNELTKQDKS